MTAPDSPGGRLPREVAAEVGRRGCCATPFPGPHDEATCTRWRPPARPEADR